MDKKTEYDVTRQVMEMLETWRLSIAPDMTLRNFEESFIQHGGQVLIPAGTAQEEVWDVAIIAVPKWIRDRLIDLCLTHQLVEKEREIEQREKPSDYDSDGNFIGNKDDLFILEDKRNV